MYYTTQSLFWQSERESQHVRLSPSSMVHPHLDLLLVCPDVPIFLLGLGGQHPSACGVGLSKKSKKKGENMHKAKVTTRNQQGKK
jgi:hypothetical protein